MEDYEKKYKEALKRAKAILKVADNRQESLGYVSTIFPELKESEDERIRKALVRFHKSTIDIDGIKGADILAWLEKQCDNNNQNWKPSKGQINALEHFVRSIGESCYASPYDDNTNLLNSLINDLYKLEKQGSSSVKWQKNTLYNKPAINHSVLMKTTQGIAEGEWQGEYWFQYRWSWTLKDSDVLAWMELSDLDEQGEQKTAVTDFNAKDWYVSKVDGKIHDMTYNPADKVDPKFKVGDWVVTDKNDTVQIKEVNNSYYTIDNGMYFNIHYVDKYWHLWTIKDANDGDVVVDKSDGTIGIFESIGHHPDGGSFNDPSYCFLHCRYDDGYFFADFEDGNMMTSDDVIPAIKEQSDILFTEMKEAGYEWSDKDRKLIKIVK